MGTHRLQREKFHFYKPRIQIPVEMTKRRKRTKTPAVMMIRTKRVMGMKTVMIVMTVTMMMRRRMMLILSQRKKGMKKKWKKWWKVY